MLMMINNITFHNNKNKKMTYSGGQKYMKQQATKPV